MLDLSDVLSNVLGSVGAGISTYGSEIEKQKSAAIKKAEDEKVTQDKILMTIISAMGGKYGNQLPRMLKGVDFSNNTLQNLIEQAKASSSSSNTTTNPRNTLRSTSQANKPRF